MQGELQAEAVGADFVFHNQDDWLFHTRGDFIRQSLEILLHVPDVLVVWYRPGRMRPRVVRAVRPARA